MTDFSRFIGRSYDHQHYNCWHFFRDIQREFGRELPAIPLWGADMRGVAKALRDHPLRAHWQAIDPPEHGCGVMMGKTLLPTHVGCWLGIDAGGVMHNTQHPGVVFTSHAALVRLGWNILGYYRYIGESNANDY